MYEKIIFVYRKIRIERDCSSLNIGLNPINSDNVHTQLAIWLEYGFINGHESDKEVRVRPSLRNLTEGVA